MSKHVWRFKDRSGWVEGSFPPELIDGLNLRPATFRERVWRNITKPTFSWLEFFVIMTFAQLVALLLTR